MSMQNYTIKNSHKKALHFQVFDISDGPSAILLHEETFELISVTTNKFEIRFSLRYFACNIAISPGPVLYVY